MHAFELGHGISSTHSEAFPASFMCEESSGCNTAEGILKSIITQLINEEESLAQHAKWFVPTPRYRGPSDEDNYDLNGTGAQATATVDDLWKYLQDIMEDPVVSSIHIIIGNIHCLEVGESTLALLSKLQSHAFTLRRQKPAARRVRWLITSRNDKHISHQLTAECVSIIDLESQDFGNKIRGDRQKHAKDAVLQLRSSKKYSSDLAFYVRNSLESRSEDETWIDVLCKLLAAMPSNSSDLAVRKD